MLRLEYGLVWLLLQVLERIPLGLGYRLSRGLGNLFYLAVRRRRALAIENVRLAFPHLGTAREIRKIARQSCASGIMSFMEAAKFRALIDQGMEEGLLVDQSHRSLLQRAREIHDKSGGCIFVTPHFGNWELFPHLAAVAGIPLIVVVRHYRNPYLAGLLHRYRASSGQIVVSNFNALFAMQQNLRRGVSVGLLADQSTRKGIAVDYFGRPALTTPVPAMLALQYQRPIVVVACWRQTVPFRFDGCVSEPIWPESSPSEKAEIYRLTQVMNHAMEEIVARHPEQYLWMHNRWKRYRTKTEVTW
jgi:KDO2-lipid IV(A) lauroyltransferase